MRQTFEKYVLLNKPHQKACPVSLGNRSELNEFSSRLLGELGFSDILKNRIFEEIAALDSEKLLSVGRTYSLSGLPISDDDYLYRGQVLELYGKLLMGEFHLLTILFSPKERDFVKQNCVFLYDDRLNGVPVFLSIRKNESQEKRIAANNLSKEVFDSLVNIILFKRSVQATNALTSLDIRRENLVSNSCVN